MRCIDEFSLYNVCLLKQEGVCMNINLVDWISANFQQNLEPKQLAWLRALLLSVDQQQLLKSGQVSVTLTDLEQQLRHLDTQKLSDNNLCQCIDSINAIAQSERMLSRFNGVTLLQIKSQPNTISLNLNARLIQNVDRVEREVKITRIKRLRRSFLIFIVRNSLENSEILEYLRLLLETIFF